MLNIQLFRNDLALIVQQLKKRGITLDQSIFSQLEAQRKVLQSTLQALQARRNAHAKHIGQTKKNGEKLPMALAEEGLAINESIKKIQAEFEEIQSQLDEWLSMLPNIPHDSVPVGKDEQGNLEIRRVGQPRSFDFTVKDHVAIGEPLGLDLDSGTKLSGSRFVVLRGAMAKLHRALVQFMLDTHTMQHGYTEHYTSYIVNQDILYGTGQLPKFAEDMFRVQKKDKNGVVEQFLISTAEITLTNLARGHIFTAEELPLRLTAHSPCFRSEAGSYGKDVRGMIRQHQFDKVEMVQIVRPQDSYQVLEEMVTHAEVILRALALPYRVMLLCTGDMGFSAAKTFDIEVWLPAQNTYREISSCSNCEDFQARRMQARFKDKTGQIQLVHTLNGSGLAVGRTLVALLENYQNKDGSVTIPQILRPYMGGIDQVVMTASN